MDMDLVEYFNEALSAAIESGINVPGSHAVTDMYRAVLARAEAAEAEAATLRAQLAAREWRPVTDAPPQSGETVEIRAHGWYSVANEKWHVYLGGDLVAHPRCVEWRPTPPQEANE